MLRSVTRIKPSFEEFAAGIAHKEYDIALGLDMQIDVTDFSLISYERYTGESWNIRICRKRRLLKE